MGLRLFADQCVPNIVIESLRSSGFEVMVLRDFLMIKSEDSIIISKAQQELDAILITLNRDLT